jgi:hypothetical protein
LLIVLDPWDCQQGWNWFDRSFLLSSKARSFEFPKPFVDVPGQSKYCRTDLLQENDELAVGRSKSGVKRNAASVLYCTVCGWWKLTKCCGVRDVGWVDFGTISVLDRLTLSDRTSWSIGCAALDRSRLSYPSFPIFEDAAKYQAEAPRKVKGIMSQAAKEAIDACAPYKGGNDALWRLHRLNNIDKHRLLVTVCAFFESVSSEHAHYISPTNNAWQPLKAGDVLTMLPTELVENENLEFTFQIAFNELEVVECKPVLETLQQMAHLVGHIVDGFKPLLG